MDLIVYFFVLIILVGLSSFFSAIEIAIFSLSNIDILVMSRDGLKGARDLEILRKNPERLLVTILIGNNLVNILASSIATLVAINLFGSIGVGIATGVMTFLILVFGEIVPKTLAVRHAKKISLRVSGVLLALERIMFPVVYLLERLTNYMIRFFDSDGLNPARSLVSEERIKEMVEIGEEEGSIEKDESEMITNVFKLNDIVADSVMIEKSKVELIDVDASVKDLLNFVTGKVIPYSRIPVCKSDKIVGILYVNDLLRFVGKSVKVISIKKLMRKPFRIHAHMKADDLLDEFRKRKVHMTIVEDKSGRFLGIVTMEDLLEELVGDIMDESDVLRSKMV